MRGRELPSGKSGVTSPSSGIADSTAGSRCAMGETTEMIDLSQSAPARPPVKNRTTRSTTPAVDLTSDSEDAAAAGVGFQQHTHHDGACCSSAPSQPWPETAGPSDAEQASDLAPVPSANKGKRKRALPDPEEVKQKAEKAKQRKEAATQKKLLAKAEKDAKTAAEKHRTNADGRVVRWAPSANQKTKERIARAMPSKSSYWVGSTVRKAYERMGKGGGECSEYTLAPIRTSKPVLHSVNIHLPYLPLAAFGIDAQLGNLLLQILDIACTCLIAR